MVRYLKLLLLAPVAVLLLVFAFANRHWVTVSINPFESGDTDAFSTPAPLFVVILISVMIGVIAGSVSTWFTQARHRRALKQARAESEKLRADLQAAKAAQTPSLPVARRA